MAEEIIKKIVKIGELIFTQNLHIPEYQRPYKWTVQNVNQLIDDILLHNDKTAYRLGTIVLHKEDEVLNIVDGQQRLLTLSLIAFELLQNDVNVKLTNLDYNSLSIGKLKFQNELSKQNLKRNQIHIRSRIKEFRRDDVLFFFNKCELVYLELTKISEAFQFFDSQNSRGKDLAPHDLLKAFHLREMSNNTEKECLECVAQWEEVSDDLSHVFANYLFKIRQWSKGRSGVNFSKSKIGVFKGITIQNSSPFNFVQPYEMNHFFAHKNNISYPFQIDQVILNGRRFFEYVHHYAKQINHIENIYIPNIKETESSNFFDFNKGSEIARTIINTLNTYGGRGRRGDRFLKNLMDCSLLYYVDKFGTKKIDEALVKSFLWVYSVRLIQPAVQLRMVETHATIPSSFFKIIRESVHPNEILHRRLALVKYDSSYNKIQNIGPLVELFTELNALEK